MLRIVWRLWAMRFCRSSSDYRWRSLDYWPRLMIKSFSVVLNISHPFCLDGRIIWWECLLGGMVNPLWGLTWFVLLSHFHLLNELHFSFLLLKSFTLNRLAKQTRNNSVAVCTDKVIKQHLNISFYRVSHIWNLLHPNATLCRLLFIVEQNHYHLLLLLFWMFSIGFSL